MGPSPLQPFVGRRRLSEAAHPTSRQSHQPRTTNMVFQALKYFCAALPKLAG